MPVRTTACCLYLCTQMDPSNGIEEEYHRKNDKVFGWRALRLAARSDVDAFNRFGELGLEGVVPPDMLVDEVRAKLHKTKAKRDAGEGKKDGADAKKESVEERKDKEAESRRNVDGGGDSTGKAVSPALPVKDTSASSRPPTAPTPSTATPLAPAASPLSPGSTATPKRNASPLGKSGNVKLEDGEDTKGGEGGRQDAKSGPRELEGGSGKGESGDGFRGFAIDLNMMAEGGSPAENRGPSHKTMTTPPGSAERKAKATKREVEEDGEFEENRSASKKRQRSDN
eukprot:TRINITY_DN21737_c0_g2_i2.p1 TRINITY_DN21737_c0_g2~~TRINITY_DN21737_c0_g2_i2.p1  ORF type:complete len:284 (-),score=26.23 TRINITY_DN21737_c0_g2_i2:220-1071(-)